MINYSIWSFEKFKDLSSFLEIVVSNKKTTRSSGKARGELELKNEITANEGFELNKIRKISIDKVEISYISFDVNVQGCTKNLETNTYEVKDFKVKVIAYESNQSINLVVLAAKSNAEKIIHRMFENQLLWGFISEVNNISEDILYWMFYRLREMQNIPINRQPNVYLKGIVSYLGKTEDEINAVRGIGNRVSALLGTLGMILGEESLRALRSVIQYEMHEIIIEMRVGNTGKIYDRYYAGSIDKLEGIEYQDALVLLTCKYIIPSIKAGYDDNVLKKIWSLSAKQIFLRAIGNEMNEKITRELDNIEKELKLAEVGCENSEADDLIGDNSETDYEEDLEGLEDEIQD